MDFSDQDSSRRTPSRGWPENTSCDDTTWNQESSAGSLGSRGYHISGSTEERESQRDMQSGRSLNHGAVEVEAGSNEECEWRSAAAVATQSTRHSVSPLSKHCVSDLSVEVAVAAAAAESPTDVPSLREATVTLGACGEAVATAAPGGPRSREHGSSLGPLRPPWRESRGARVADGALSDVEMEGPGYRCPCGDGGVPEATSCSRKNTGWARELGANDHEGPSTNFPATPHQALSRYEETKEAAGVWGFLPLLSLPYWCRWYTLAVVSSISVGVGIIGVALLLWSGDCGDKVFRFNSYAPQAEEDAKIWQSLTNVSISIYTTELSPYEWQQGLQHDILRFPVTLPMSDDSWLTSCRLATGVSPATQMSVSWYVPFMPLRSGTSTLVVYIRIPLQPVKHGRMVFEANELVFDHIAYSPSTESVCLAVSLELSGSVVFSYAMPASAYCTTSGSADKIVTQPYLSIFTSLDPYLTSHMVLGSETQVRTSAVGQRVLGIVFIIFSFIAVVSVALFSALLRREELRMAALRRAEAASLAAVCPPSGTVSRCCDGKPGTGRSHKASGEESELRRMHLPSSGTTLTGRGIAATNTDGIARSSARVCAVSRSSAMAQETAPQAASPWIVPLAIVLHPWRWFTSSAGKRPPATSHHGSAVSPPQTDTFGPRGVCQGDVPERVSGQNSPSCREGTGRGAAEAPSVIAVPARSSSLCTPRHAPSTHRDPTQLNGSAGYGNRAASGGAASGIGHLHPHDNACGHHETCVVDGAPEKPKNVWTNPQQSSLVLPPPLREVFFGNRPHALSTQVCCGRISPTDDVQPAPSPPMETGAAVGSTVFTVGKWENTIGEGGEEGSARV